MSGEPQQASEPSQADQSEDSEIQLIPSASINPASPSPSSAISTKIGEKRHDTETCPICLFKITDEARCFANQCFHSFCYECLLEWSKVKPSCPLCKTPFSVIIHEIRSNDAYKEHRIVAEPSAPALSMLHVTNNRLNWLYHNMRTQAANTWYAGHQESPIAFRRLVYLNDWYVSLTNMDTRAPAAQEPNITLLTRYRDTRASFFRKNPACTHRLYSFVVRELITINRLTGQYMAHEQRRPIGSIRHAVFELLARHDIDSEGFLHKLRQFVKPNRFAKHFQHELYAYARSVCHSMLDYDAKCVYFEGRTSVPVNMGEYRLYSDNPPAAIWNEVHLRDSLTLEDEQENEATNGLRVGINEAILLDGDVSEASVQHYSDDSDASNYCEEVVAAPQSSPDYIVLSSDDEADDSARKRIWTSDSDEDSARPTTSKMADERLRRKKAKKKKKKKAKKKRSVDGNETTSCENDELSRDAEKGAFGDSKLPLPASPFFQMQVARNKNESSDES